MNQSTVKFKIRQDKEWDEWIVEVRIDGKLNEEKSYHTDDYNDAQNTRCAMVVEAKEHPERYLPEKKTKKSWDGYNIPEICKDRECGKCNCNIVGRKFIGCTVPVDETACEFTGANTCDGCAEIELCKSKKGNRKTEKATTEYECACGEIVKPGIELHICQSCGTKQCPNCFDYDNTLCEECISK